MAPKASINLVGQDTPPPFVFVVMLAAASVAPFAYAGPVAPLTAAPRTSSPVMQEVFKKFTDEFTIDTTFEKPWTSDEISDKEGLKALALKLNPVIGYWGARQPIRTNLTFAAAAISARTLAAPSSMRLSVRR